MTSTVKPFIMLTCLCLTYLGIELLYNHYTMLSVDEFWFAHRIYEYKSGLPYRDFAPYKTILGYYLLLPPMLSGHGIMQTLILTKNSFAILNMLILFVSSLWLTRFFTRKGILSSLAILILAETVVAYSTQLRVDLLGYWFGFFSLLLLLEKRYWLAGVLMGLAFITTQKTIWYLFACNCALAMHWIIYQRKFKSIKPIVLFNMACASIILFYLGFWAMISDWNTVINSVFHEASAMYRLAWYDASRKLFWKTIILSNPFLFLFWPISLFSLFISYKNDKSYSSRLFVVTFAFVILLCLLPYKQVFPYYMQVTIPVFFILYAAVLSWLIDLFQQHLTLRLLIKPFYLWIMLACYLIGIAYLAMEFHLPKPYLLIGLIPISFMLVITTHKMAVSLFRIILITSIFVGFIYPLSLFPAKLTWLNGSYQQAHIQTIYALTGRWGLRCWHKLIYNKRSPYPVYVI